MTTKTTSEALPQAGQRNLYLGIFITAILIFGAATMLVLSGKPTGWEYALFTAINGWPNGGSQSLVTLFGIITFFGSTWMALLSVAGLFAAHMYRLAWRLALTIIGAYGVAFLAKHFIGRERPAEILHNVSVRTTETGMGFPSGHATLSTVIAFTVWPYIPTKAKYVLVPLFIGLVCLSRLYLGVHFPLDLVGGIAVGVAAVSFVRILPQAFRRWLRVS